jgi:hypothetical protein
VDFETYRSFNERFHQVLVPPKFPVHTFPEWGIPQRFAEWIPTCTVRKRGPISKSIQALEECTLLFKASDELTLPLKRI